MTIENLPLILMIALLLHVVLMRKLNHARDPYRMALAGRFHELKSAGAPDWLLDFWMTAMGRGTFSHGKLKWALLVYVARSGKLKETIDGVQHKVNRLPQNLREIHDHMDRDLAILLLLSSPYFTPLLFVVTLFVKGSVELTKIVPARDARGSLLTTRYKHA